MSRKKNAFSLIELVLVITVSAIAIPGIILTFYELSRKSVYDESIAVATVLVEGQLERVIQKSFVTIETGEPTENNPASFSGNFSGYRWYLSSFYVNGEGPLLTLDLDDEAAGSTEYKQVEVRVSNNIMSSGDFVSLKAIVTNN